MVSPCDQFFNLMYIVKIKLHESLGFKTNLKIAFGI